MAGDPGPVPPGVDARLANTARVYDYWLGGRHNFPADQDVAQAIAAVAPNAPAIAVAGRAFIGRAVRFLAAAGIRQFLTKLVPCRVTFAGLGGRSGHWVECRTQVV